MNHPVYEEHRNEQGILVSRHLNTLDCQICQSSAELVQDRFLTAADLNAAETETWATVDGACPKTGRSASVCEDPEHSTCPDLRPRGDLKRELARVAQEVSEQYVTEARHMRDTGRPDVALAKAEVAEAFRYFGELVHMSEIGEETRQCLNCQGTGQRSWPQSRRDHLGRVTERLAPQITKCAACQGTGRIASDPAHDEYDRYHAQDPGSAGPGALPH